MSAATSLAAAHADPQARPTGKARLKVLHVVRQYAPSVGGLETYVAELAQRQSARHDVAVLTLDRLFDVPGRLPREEKVGGVQVYRMPFAGRRKLFVPRLEPSLLRRFDILHVHATDQIVDVLALLAPFRLPPFVLTTHGLFFHTEDLLLIKEAYLRSISRVTLPRAREIFAVSGADRARLAKVGIASTLLRNPIVPYAGGMASGGDFLYVGRVSANKRVELLVDMVAELRDRGSPIGLHIVGTDTEGLWPKVNERILARGVTDLVHAHGFLAAGDLARLASRCGYVVSASRYEGYGLSVVEGMSVGLLPVVQANDAFQETVDLSGCGLLTDFTEPAAAAETFLAWRHGEGDSPEARQRAAAFARTHSWDSLLEVVDESYRRALVS
jgi:alpha-1,3-mannosyltransferase